jgi:hypothetical protein
MYGGSKNGGFTAKATGSFTEVQMTYDASGNRVLKKVVEKSPPVCYALGVFDKSIVVENDAPGVAPTSGVAYVDGAYVMEAYGSGYQVSYFNIGSEGMIRYEKSNNVTYKRKYYYLKDHLRASFPSRFLRRK